MIDNKEIIRKEIEAILDDVRKAYEESGKKVSGQFDKDLSAVYENNKATIIGNFTLAGRKAGEMPPIENLKKWVLEKGIFQVQNDVQATSLAWAIAKTIAKKGTNKDYHLKIYEQIITPQRIDKVIHRVSEINVNYFTQELTTSLKRIAKNI